MSLAEKEAEETSERENLRIQANIAENIAIDVDQQEELRVMANEAESIAQEIDQQDELQANANMAEEIAQEIDTQRKIQDERDIIVNRANEAENIATRADNDIATRTRAKKAKAIAAIKAKQSARFRELLYGAKKKDDKENSRSDEQEDAREARAVTHLRNEISQDLTDDATQEEIIAHHQAELAEYAIGLAEHQSQLQAKQQEKAKIEAGWSALRSAAHHLHDAASYLKQKQETLANQVFVDKGEGLAPIPGANVATIVSPVVLDESFVQIDPPQHQLDPKDYPQFQTKVTASPSEGAANLMAKLKQLKSPRV